MEMNLKNEVFTKVQTDDEIDEKDADVSSDHFLLKIWGGGQFRQISRYLGFPECRFKLVLALSLPFFLDFWSCVKKRKNKSMKFVFWRICSKIASRKTLIS